MTDEQFWTTERRFWLEGASVYDSMLDANCLMVFPGVGILHGATAIADSLRGAPRWDEVRMSERVLMRPSDQLAVLGYRAQARRGDAAAYLANCSTTYRLDLSGWKLVQHQHTPAT